MERIAMVLWIVLAGLLVGGCSLPRPVESLRSEGDFHFEYERFDQAAEAYQAIVDRTPGDWHAQYQLGLCRLELGQPTPARRALEAAHSLRPGNRDVADALAEAMFQQRAYDQLFAFLRQRADASRSTHSYMNLGRYSMEIGDMDSASVALLTAIEVDEGQSAEPYLLRADFAERVGRTDEVLRRLRQAYGINPRDQRVIDRIRAYGEVPGPTFSLPPGR